MSLSGKKIVIVGAATSIGQVVVNSFLQCGASVLATIHRQYPQSLNHPEVTVASLDLQDLNSLDLFCSKVVTVFGQIDVVIFLSGVLPGRNLSEYDDELLQQVMMINFIGQAALLRRLIPHFSESALVLMVSSISAERGSYDPIYAAAKAAQIGLVKSLATGLAPGVRVNAIAPGLIENSTMFHDMSLERRDYHLKKTPTGRLTTKDDIASIIINMCEPAWNNVNGQVIRVNGGAYV